MMEYDVNSHPLMKLGEAAQPEAFVKYFQNMMLAGKAIETMTVDSTKMMLQQSYQQSLKLIEEMDKQFAYRDDQQQSLCFPFDLMDQVTRNMADQWSVLTGLPTSSVDQLSESLEVAKTKEEELSKLVAEQESQISELNQSVLDSQALVTKATKAKQTAQRNARKAKADLEAATETNKQLEEQLNQLEVVKAQALDENQSLVEQNTTLKQQLASLQVQLEAVSQGS
ncbi:hypothetical protein PTW35_22370 (plasmid) [Photobacterium sp. DA100]|uniref:hypothetical protein n=1 Tax=Photobacterium sp. DA100 TaxID=3027472 RepID=UPI0024788001|nr:hypothetical protein [Photobacterium sp. DA100]WEM45819.1 hypothetical protein PTW35_22370 [Photobacterium sp. DA100]